MRNSALAQTLIKFAIRRGLSFLGAAGASVSDDWVTQTAALAVAAGNELVQWWLSYRTEKQKRGQA